VNLAVRYRHEILNIDQIAGPNIIRSIDWLGKRAPLHSGAAAKALLAHLEDAEIETYLNGADAAGTDLEPTQFWGEIEKIRTQGFAINRGELDPLIFAVGRQFSTPNVHAVPASQSLGIIRRFSTSVSMSSRVSPSNRFYHISTTWLSGSSRRSDGMK
jgi:DNA-binding IclR family transcriptional regulator